MVGVPSDLTNLTLCPCCQALLMPIWANALSVPGAHHESPIAALILLHQTHTALLSAPPFVARETLLAQSVPGAARMTLSEKCNAPLCVPRAGTSEPFVAYHVLPAAFLVPSHEPHAIFSAISLPVAGKPWIAHSVAVSAVASLFDKHLTSLPPTAPRTLEPISTKIVLPVALCCISASANAIAPVAVKPVFANSGPAVAALATDGQNFLHRDPP